MPEPKRQLAAIMFTDVVGYTRLMGENEDKALELLRNNRAIHVHLIEKFNGNLIKEIGDGNLVQFRSTVDAVQCAIEIQQKARTELNGQIRIGIHLGDVTFENNDVFGDGVNIASRIQSIADPGGIYISESVQKSVKASGRIFTKYLGEFNFKNVDYAVRTYALEGEGLPTPDEVKLRKLVLPDQKKPIHKSLITYLIFIAILITFVFWFQNKDNKDNADLKISSLVFLPFDNFTGTDTLEYMMAGMHDALIGEVGRIGSLRVPGTKTANVYRASEKSIPEIANELKVDAGVETSVSCYGETICFQVKLVRAFPVEKQIWVKNFSIDKSQIHNWYKELAKEISDELGVILTPKEQLLLASKDSIDPRAYELYMKGRFHLNQINYESLKNAKEYFNLAKGLEPDWAEPYAGLAEVGNYQKQIGIESYEIVLPMIKENLRKAFELDSNSANAHYVNALNAVWTEFNWEKGEKEFKRSLGINPNGAYTRIFYAHLLMILRRTGEALSEAKKAEELEPLDPFVQGLYADVLRRSADYEGAKQHAEKGLAIEPNHQFALHELIGIYPYLGEYEKAYKIKRLNPLWQHFGVTDHMDSIFRQTGWMGVVEEEIKLHEEDTVIGGQEPVNQFLRYLETGNLDKAVDQMYLLYEMRNPNVPYISAINHYKELKNHKRYLQLLEKLNLPTD